MSMSKEASTGERNFQRGTSWEAQFLDSKSENIPHSLPSGKQGLAPRPVPEAVCQRSLVNRIAVPIVCFRNSLLVNSVIKRPPRDGPWGTGQEPGGVDPDGTLR